MVTNSNCIILQACSIVAVQHELLIFHTLTNHRLALTCNIILFILYPASRCSRRGQVSYKVSNKPTPRKLLRYFQMSRSRVLPDYIHLYLHIEKYLPISCFVITVFYSLLLYMFYEILTWYKVSNSIDSYHSLITPYALCLTGIRVIFKLQYYYHVSLEGLFTTDNKAHRWGHFSLSSPGRGERPRQEVISTLENQTRALMYGSHWHCPPS